MVKVLDFGVAKILSEARGATVAVGAPAYMAPEQTNTQGEVGPQADVWALGLLVFRLLAGVPYWKALATGEGGPVHLWREVLVDPLVPASVRARELGRDGMLPEGFDGWFARCVEREVSGRFEDASEAHKVLGGVLAVASPSGTGTLPRISLSRELREPALLATALASGEVAPTLKTGPKGTARVTFREKSERIVLEVSRGSTLLEASLSNGIPHHHVCGGRARCTTCRVVLLDGGAAAGPRTAQEEAVASARRWPSSIRLACQLRVLGDMTVRRLVVDDDDRDTVNASVSTEEPATEEAVTVALYLTNFADFAREHLPYDVVHVLNRYIKQFCELALANQGDIVRYESTGVLLSFGGGVVSPRALADAVRTALRVQARAQQLNGYVLRHFGAQFTVAVGIHVGRLLRAPLGHATRTEQVVFGDGVDGAWSAARAATEAGVNVVATEAVLARHGSELRLGTKVELRPSGQGAEVVDFARPDVHMLVQSTFERLEGRWNEFASSFYDRLFALDPAIGRLFEFTDMEAQRGMLMEVLATAIRGLDRFDSLIPVLRELGGRHVAYGTKSSHYKQVGAALLATLEEFLGSEFTPEVHLAWMEVYGAVAREMIAGSKAATTGG
jgi:ferredoxin/hemoglobin-like flavoprotein